LGVVASLMSCLRCREFIFGFEVTFFEEEPD
jgi:hypothetical protein